MDGDSKLALSPARPLAIVIPTFDRADYLEECLRHLEPTAARFEIPIYVSDNASTDRTPDVVARWQGRCKQLFYRRNDKNLGPDRNFELALRWPDTEFVWLLGDSYRLSPECVDHLLGAIGRYPREYDAYVYNAWDRVTDVMDRDYSSADQLLADLGWHMTCMSTLVFSRSLILGAKFARYRETSFIQNGIIFEYIDGRDFKIGWCQSLSVQAITLSSPKVSWREKILTVWVDQWVAYVLSLPPSLDPEAKRLCIVQHGRKALIFTPADLIGLRSDGLLTLDSVRRRAWAIRQAIAVPYLALLCISILPRRPLPRLLRYWRGLVRRWRRLTAVR